MPPVCEGAQLALSEFTAPWPTSVAKYAQHQTSSGTCADNGYKDVTRDECKAYRDAQPNYLSFTDLTMDDRPAGCFLWSSGTAIYFNVPPNQAAPY